MITTVVVVCGAAVGLRYLAAYMTSGLRSASGSAALNSLSKVHECAKKYAQDHPDKGYPASLAPLGAKGTNCIQPELLTGTRSGYRFRYEPRVIRDGRIQSYAMIAVPVEFGRTGDASFFTDESGALRMTREQREATATDPPVE